MPLPLDKIKRLGNYSGNWSLCVRCLCCQHQREIPAAMLIRRYGERKLLAELVPHLYCSPCECKGCECKGTRFDAVIDMPR